MKGEKERYVPFAALDEGGDNNTALSSAERVGKVGQSAYVLGRIRWISSSSATGEAQKKRKGESFLGTLAQAGVSMRWMPVIPRSVPKPSIAEGSRKRT